MIEIDASFGEGGGQILRSALALSVITGKPMRLPTIRVRRPLPGMRPQDVKVVEAAARISQHLRSNAELLGWFLSVSVELGTAAPRPLPTANLTDLLSR